MKAVSKLSGYGKVLSVTSVSKASGRGVYRYVVNGKVYNGSTNNIARRLAEHQRRLKANGEKMTHFSFEPHPGISKLSLRQKEQGLIDELGGIGCNTCRVQLRNKINAVRKP